MSQLDEYYEKDDPMNYDESYELGVLESIWESDNISDVVEYAQPSFFPKLTSDAIAKAGSRKSLSAFVTSPSLRGMRRDR